MERSRPNRIREALGHLNEAQPPYFREYLRRFQEDPSSRVFAPLAEAYRRLGRYDEAISVCQEGLEHHPDFHGGRIVLAKCYMAKNQSQEARAELERVVRAVPENLLGQRLLADVHASLGNKSQALHCYKMALLLAPNDVSLNEKVHELETGGTAAPEAPPAAPLSALPQTPEDIEAEIPPLWSMEVPPQPSADPPSAPHDPPLFPEPDVVGLAALVDDGDAPIDDEAFKIEHVSSIFDEGEERSKKEITTETLGDLYFSQGQFDKALRIFEKLKPTAGLQKKILAARSKLGVDLQTQLRARKIAVLKAVIQRSRAFRQ